VPQVARLVEENRGLRHRLAKYEASPQQARYKYARQTAPHAASNSQPRSAGSRPTSSSPLTSGGGRNGSSNKGPTAGTAAARSKGSGGAAAKPEGRDRHDACGGGGGGGGSNCGNPVSCVNSRESAAFADRVLQF